MKYADAGGPSFSPLLQAGSQSLQTGEGSCWWGGAGSIERYVDAERGPLACITVSPPAAATTTVLRSIVSISIHAAARSMQHQKSADGSRSCAADVYWNTRDFVTQHFASGTL